MRTIFHIFVAATGCLMSWPASTQAQLYPEAACQRLPPVPASSEDASCVRCQYNDGQAGSCSPVIPEIAPACGPDCCDEDCITYAPVGAPSQGWQAWSGSSGFKGIADGTNNANFGSVTGINYGSRLDWITDWTGLRGQIGGSFGAYDFNGRSTGFDNQTQIQQQVFLTTGLFRRANQNSNWSGGIVYDWMINNNYGVYATSPTLGQWRGQLGYVLNTRNEIGLMAAVRDRGHTEVVNIAGTNTSVFFKAVDQTNLFWHHKWDFAADSWLWIGTPNHTKFGANGGSLGDLIVGSSILSPLNDSWAVYGNAQYMAPSARAGVAASQEQSWNLGFGLVFCPHGTSRTDTVAGHEWLPYLPVANNSNFLVDTSHTQ